MGVSQNQGCFSLRGFTLLSKYGGVFSGRIGGFTGTVLLIVYFVLRIQTIAVMTASTSFPAGMSSYRHLVVLLGSEKRPRRSNHKCSFQGNLKSTLNSNPNLITPKALTQQTPYMLVPLNPKKSRSREESGTAGCTSGPKAFSRKPKSKTLKPAALNPH